ncbi:cyanate transporter [Pseudomonas sp. NPDC089734]|uniref:cyanate transporter n=1 Tax=Pseudomonas sp. NPDC089734 TaxID=3364469 RepID=UPI0037F8A716
MENIRTSTAHAFWLMASVVLVALNLRPSMAAVGPLLSAIRGDMPLSFSLASLLTMLPVLAMGLGMFFGMRLAQSLGEHRAIVWSLLVIGIASAARLFIDGAVELILSAILSGLGIAMIQALMPALIKTRFKENVSLFMGLYVTSIMGGAALAASFSPFVLKQSGSWQIALAIWAILALLALVLWTLQRSAIPVVAPAPKGRTESFFASSRAWLLAIFFGLGTASYTCVLAWLAPYYVERGWSEQDAGLVLGFLTAMEVLAGLAVPTMVNQTQDKRWALTALLLLIIAGFCGLILSFDHMALLWPCLLGLGIGGLFPMSLIISMDHIDNPARAGSLTAFVQGIGYLIAGLSPLLAGVIRDQSGSFEGAWWTLAAVIAAMIGIVWRFNPRHYRQHISPA